MHNRVAKTACTQLCVCAAKQTAKKQDKYQLFFHNPQTQQVIVCVYRFVYKDTNAAASEIDKTEPGKQKVSPA